MAINKRKYGIKFPFICLNNDNLVLDLNNSLHEKVASEIAHVILTPKKTRIRMPDFGTNLMKYIFEANEKKTWGEIEDEIREAVKNYVPQGVVNNVDVYKDEKNINSFYIAISFGVRVGENIENNKMILNI